METFAVVQNGVPRFLCPVSFNLVGIFALVKK